ncbi:hypothetical protein [Bradyrhizobium sacchari]|uniref:hypothetical protein n=1 Tax=Bradyrhizobium sacchari TaxID=1399419 RepID=UPI0010A975E3|nr:hypothetical protein [Bradyrhizobium sacchari]
MNDAGWQLGIECARVLDLVDAALFGGDNNGMQIRLIAPDGPAHRRGNPGSQHCHELLEADAAAMPLDVHVAGGDTLAQNKRTGSNGCAGNDLAAGNQDERISKASGRR